MKINNKKNLYLLFIILLFIALFGIVKTNANAVTFAENKHVKNGITYYDSKYTKQTGTMKDNGAINKTINLGETYTIPEGYHDGNGTITASNIVSSKNPTTTLIGSALGEDRNDVTISFKAKPNTRYFAIGSYVSTVKGWGWETDNITATNSTVDVTYQVASDTTSNGYMGSMVIFSFKTNDIANEETVTLDLDIAKGKKQLILLEVTY